MRTALACFSFLLAGACCLPGLYWIVGSVGISSLLDLSTLFFVNGWRAVVINLALPAIGVVFLVAGAKLLGRVDKSWAIE
ncbi:MAG: hypothetical protein H0T51_06735 [Pirellulales bacterium]|nr:hypothetical protein [Pirellulales bacterium]